MNLPDCQIIECEQRSPEWFSARRGVLTASNFGPWLMEVPEVRLTVDEIKAILDDSGINYPKKAKKDALVAILPDADRRKTLTKTGAEARESAICKIIAGVAECWEPTNFENDAMKRGTELEPEAIESFEKLTGKKVRQVGFCRSLHGRFGCSPDGLIVGESAGIESKVPVPSTHIAYRRSGELPDEYRFQVHGSMAVTGAREWWFQSYNPGLANLRLVVKRDAFTEELFTALKEFGRQAELALIEEGNAWEREFKA